MAPAWELVLICDTWACGLRHPHCPWLTRPAMQVIARLFRSLCCCCGCGSHSGAAKAKKRRKRRRNKRQSECEGPDHSAPLLRPKPELYIERQCEHRLLSQPKCEVPDRECQVLQCGVSYQEGQERHCEVSDQGGEERHCEVFDQGGEERQCEVPDQGGEERQCEVPDQGGEERQCEVPDQGGEEQQCEVPDQERRVRQCEVSGQGGEERQCEVSDQGRQCVQRLHLPQPKCEEPDRDLTSECPTMMHVTKGARGVQAAVLHYAAPVARKIRFVLTEEQEQMEREVAVLRRELDESRAALRQQSARCRQLVAAYSARLRERSAQVRAGSALRDHQLALVLRALLALEARLRREQQLIRAQLAQRDAVIHQQQVEISKLRQEARARRGPGPGPPHQKPPPSAKPSELIVVNHTCGQDSPCQEPPPPPAEEQRKRRGSSKPKQHQDAALRVLQLTSLPLPLLNGETASIVDAGIEPPADFIEDNITPPPDVVASYNDMNRECFELANMAASLRAAGAGVGNNQEPPRYQDNPVLECVNLILLRDRDASPPAEPSPSLPRAWYGGEERDTTTASTPTSPSSTERTPPALPPKPPRLVPTRPSPPIRTIITAKEGHLDSSPSTDATPKIISNGSGAFNLVKKNRPETLPKPLYTHPRVISLGLGPGDHTDILFKDSVDTTPDSIINDDASDALRRNFEEFNLDDCDIEGLGEDVPHEGRPEGDGAECRINGVSHQDILALSSPAANYDTFLEATGLSNKSILTPSRMLSNHRSVLKPKDVKHRSRVKAGERCLTTAVAGPTTKYWMEPFL